MPHCCVYQVHCGSFYFFLFLNCLFQVPTELEILIGIQDALETRGVCALRELFGGQDNLNNFVSYLFARKNNLTELQSSLIGGAIGGGNAEFASPGLHDRHCKSSCHTGLVALQIFR